MKNLISIAVLASTFAVPSAFAGRDGVQIMQQERAAAERRAEAQQPMTARASTWPARNIRESRRDNDLRLLKLFHPKHAY